MRDLRRLLKYLRPHWPIFTVATLAMVLVGVLESATGGLIVPIFDQAFVQGGASQRTATIFGLQRLIPQDPFGAWKVISILLIVFTLTKGVAEYLSIMQLTHARHPPTAFAHPQSSAQSRRCPIQKQVGLSNQESERISVERAFEVGWRAGVAGMGLKGCTLHSVTRVKAP